MNPNASISRFFKVYEVGKSRIAIRMGIDNTPPSDVLERASHHARTVLDPLRDQFGPLSPQSWYRGDALERQLTWDKGFRKWCGKNHVAHGEAAWPDYFALKSHPLGEATDIEYPQLSNRYLFDWIKKNTPSYDQLILEFFVPGDPTSGWVHISSKVKGNREMAFFI